MSVIAEVSLLSKEEFIVWYMSEMARLFPDAVEGMDYSVTDAEFQYEELQAEKGVSSTEL
jgi:hypothetical protein